MNVKNTFFIKKYTHQIFFNDCVYRNLNFIIKNVRQDTRNKILFLQKYKKFKKTKIVRSALVPLKSIH